MNRRIILASTSPRRKELLSKIVAEFEIIPSDYEEDMTLPLSPDELVCYLSKGKAESVAKDYDDAIVIGADTIVFYDGKILGKPHTTPRAYEMLNLINDTEHSVFTGFTVIDTKNNKIISKSVESKVKLKKLTEKEIKDYIDTGEPLSRAGAYDIHTVKDTFVEEIIGDYDNIRGLPVEPLMQILREFGVEIQK